MKEKKENCVLDKKGKNAICERLFDRIFLSIQPDIFRLCCTRFVNVKHCAMFEGFMAQSCLIKLVKNVFRNLM